MRGKDVPIVYDNGAIGITPAYAGKSRSQHLPPSLSWDHPRLCGEKWKTVLLLVLLVGSPPPMRGKAGNARVYGNAQGITPAYAGKR